MNAIAAAFATGKPAGAASTGGRCGTRTGSRAALGTAATPTVGTSIGAMRCGVASVQPSNTRAFQVPLEGKVTSAT
jgi:hypothetical protein